jgi:uncharacterized RmlC-like cupin family protein
MRHYLSYCFAIILLLFAPCVMAESPVGNTVITIRPPTAEATKQGVSQFVGISGKNAGSKGISMNKVVIPAGGAAKAHTHSGYESTIYLIKGRVQTFFGEGLQKSVINEEGDFIYIPAGVLHKPVNLSKTESAIAIVSRNDPDEQEHVIVHDEE